MIFLSNKVSVTEGISPIPDAIFETLSPTEKLLSGTFGRFMEVFTTF